MYRVALRVAIELLSGRVNQLCHHIESNGLQCPSMPINDEKVLNRVLKTLGLAKGRQIVEQGWDEASGQASVREDPSRMALLRAANADAFHGNHESILENQDDGNPDAPSQQSPSTEGHDQGAEHQYYVQVELNSAAQAVDQEFSTYGEAVFDNGSLLNWGGTLGEPEPMNDEILRPPNTQGENIAEAFLPLNGFDPLVQISTIDHMDVNNQVRDANNAESTGEELIDQLSNRMGKLHIGHNGHIRYYGATSNFNLIEMPDPDNLTVHRTVRVDGPKYLKLLDIDKDIPPEIESHLISLYFTWQDPTFHVVNRAMYEKAKISWLNEEEDTIYYSEALRNAM